MNDNSLEMQNIIQKYYDMTVYLLNVTEEQLTIEDFNRYEAIISMQLAVKGIGVDALSEIQIQFLFYLYCGCEAMKKGTIPTFMASDLSNRIKREKRVDLEIEYQRITDPTAQSPSTCTTSKTYCQMYDEYIKVLADTQTGSLSTKQHTIGATGGAERKCCIR